MDKGERTGEEGVRIEGQEEETVRGRDGDMASG